MNHLLQHHHYFFGRPEVWIKAVKNPGKNWPGVDYLCSHFAIGHSDYQLHDLESILPQVAMKVMRCH